MGACLPALEVCQPRARIVVVETAKAPRLAKALRLGQAGAGDRQEAGNQDADFGDVHVPQ